VGYAHHFLVFDLFPDGFLCSSTPATAAFLTNPGDQAERVIMKVEELLPNGSPAEILLALGTSDAPRVIHHGHER
jgi:hypothetical protein